jgi:hypothetical protein
MFLHHLDVVCPWPLLRSHLQHHPAERHNVRLEEPDATKKWNHQRCDEGGVTLGQVLVGGAAATGGCRSQIEVAAEEAATGGQR